MGLGRGLLLLVLVGMAGVVGLPGRHPVLAGGMRAAGQGACAGAGNPTNAVVHYYLAIDSRRFDAAYACLAADVRGTTSTAAFAQGYARTMVSRLLLADLNADGTVEIDLHAFDRVASLHAGGAAGPISQSTFLGTWGVDTSLALTAPAIRMARRTTVPAVAPADPADVFAYDRQRVVGTTVASVTGLGRHDALYVTQGKRGYQAWVYSQGRLVFAEPVAGSGALQAGPDGQTLLVPIASGTPERWRWTPYGFVLAGSAGSGPPAGTLVVRPLSARVDHLVTLSGRAPADATVVPPFVELFSVAHQRVVRPNKQPCGGPSDEPVATAVVLSGGHGRAGSAWSATFRVPAQLSSSSLDGGQLQVATAPGAYRLVAIYAGIDLCPSSLLNGRLGAFAMASLTIAG